MKSECCTSWSVTRHKIPLESIGGNVVRMQQCASGDPAPGRYNESVGRRAPPVDRGLNYLLATMHFRSQFFGLMSAGLCLSSIGEVFHSVAMKSNRLAGVNHVIPASPFLLGLLILLITWESAPRHASGCSKMNGWHVDAGRVHLSAARRSGRLVPCSHVSCSDDQKAGTYTLLGKLCK